jgi:lipopolysaccharide/colanic/teichoic acid biosynthesis glycosyltransferase
MAAPLRLEQRILHTPAHGVQVIAVARPLNETQLRILNVAVAAVGIIVAAPVMLLIALVIKLTSRGPVMFNQTRVGVDRRGPSGGSNNARRSHDVGGRPFTIFKFRTMRADSGSAQVWARPDDDRVTPVGGFLRKYRLDELPQLFNVLRGDMNVVGPRPEQPALFARLREQIDHYPSRQWVRPGITGWAQINLAYDRTVEDVRRKLDYDLEYIGRRSLMEDLKIMIRTVPVMMGRRGAW